MKKRQRKSYIDKYFKDLKLEERAKLFDHKVSSSFLITNYYSIIKLEGKEELDDMTPTTSAYLDILFKNMTESFEVDSKLDLNDFLESKEDHILIEDGYAIDIKMLKNITNIIKPSSMYLMKSSKHEHILFKLVNDENNELALLLPMTDKKDKKL